MSRLTHYLRRRQALPYASLRFADIFRDGAPYAMLRAKDLPRDIMLVFRHAVLCRCCHRFHT